MLMTRVFFSDQMRRDFISTKVSDWRLETNLSCDLAQRAQQLHMGDVASVFRSDAAGVRLD